MGAVERIAASLVATCAVILVLSAGAVAVGARVFGMSIGGATALYFVVWWTTLFAVLPFGARSQADAGEVSHGSDPGAPALPGLREKAVWTTVAAAVVFAIAAWLLPLTGL